MRNISSVILFCALYCIPVLAQEGVTSPLSSTETFKKTSTTDTTRIIRFPSASMYSRSIPTFLFGVNWGTFGNRAMNETMGLRFVDDHYVELPGKLSTYPVGSRIVAGLHHEGGQGNLEISLSSAFSSRVDPELTLDTTTFWCDPRWSYGVIRTGDKSGAIRGFRNRHTSLVVEDSVVRCVPDLFSTLPATILSGNTNARVMTAYGDPGDSLNGTELYVLLQVRRLGGRDTNISATDDTPVLRLRLDGYGRTVLQDGEQQTSYRKVNGDTDRVYHQEHPIYFRRTPKPTASATAFRMVPYKTSADTAPSELWHYGHPTGLKRGYVWDDDTSAMRVVHDTMIESHPNVSSWSRYITITRGMLHASGNRVPLTGTYDMTTETDATWPVDADGSCAGPWVTYRGLVTFRTDRRIRIRSNPDSINKVTINPAFTRNEYYFRGRPHPTAKDLRVTVEYLGHDTVEIDFVEFRTPHAHDVLTDEYRSEIMESIGHFEQQYLNGVAAAGRDTSQFKIMGFRIMEERGEPLWRAYRYFNQLLRGYAFGVMSTQPYDHFRHTLDVDGAPPQSNGDRTWYWDYAPSGLANEQTAVPFLRNAQPYVHSEARLNTIFPPSTRKAIDLNNRVAFGLKYGVERSYHNRLLWPNAGYAGASSSTQPWNAGYYRNSLSLYELSHGLTMDVTSANKSHLKTFNETQLLGNLGQTGYPTLTEFTKYYLTVEGRSLDYEYRNPSSDSAEVHGWYDTPLQVVKEANLYERLVRGHNRKRFYDGTPWIGHVWLYDNFAVRYPDTLLSSWLVHSRQAQGGRRRLTAEEFRSDLILPVLLGARSVIVFYGGGREIGHSVDATMAEFAYERGFRNHRPWPIPSSGGCVSLLDTCRNKNLDTAAGNTLDLRRVLRGDDADLYFGSDRMTRLTAPEIKVPVVGPLDTIVATAAVPHVILTGPDSTLRSNSLVADRWLLTKGVTDTETGVDILGLYSNNGVQHDSIDRSDEIYMAMRSPRREAAMFGWALQRKIPNPTSWTAGDTTWMDRLAELRLVGWYGHGYTTQTSHDVARYGTSSPLSGLIDVAGIRTRHPYRYYNTVRDFEPRDSAFFDVTVLRRVKPKVSGPGLDTVALHNEFYLGVANRRTNPLVIDEADTTEYPFGRWRFVTPYDMANDSVLRQRPYEQLGSREIDVPLRYAHPDGKPRLIRITEMPLNLLGSFDYDTVDVSGREIEHVVTIDTIVDSRSRLIVNLLPGEGKLFRCVVLPATDTVGTGYLAFSTQNKMVVWPVLNPTGTAYSDSLRYHAVYHRRDTEPTRAVWSVFYQRSRPYHRDSMPLVAGLDWEAPIRLSRVTTVSTPSTDGLSKTRYFAVDSIRYEEDVPDTAAPIRDCCCGFPSMVIRETEPLHPKIFVVYACEDEWARNEVKGDYFHIVENAFNDAESLVPAILDANGKSLVVAKKNRTHDGGVDTLKSLARHGTPVINASADNLMYYAWSASNAGIGIGVKRGTDDWFPTTAHIDVVQTIGINWYPVPGDTQVLGGDEPLYPSLNVYSNIAQGHTDATLVWQDGVTNKHIRYTRLVPKMTGNTLDGIDRMLPHFIDMSFDTGAPPPIPVHHAAKIAVVGAAPVDEEAEMPVVIRSLQQDTMSMFVKDEIHDTAGRIVTYNHESVVYGEWIPWSNMHRIRYNHFVDHHTPGVPELHYWWIGTTHGGSTLSLFHPVATQGLPRYDSLTWQGMIDTVLVTYLDSLHIFHGDLSDSTLILNYSVMNKGSYQAHRGHKLNGDAKYWTGLGQFSALQTQQITLRRLPRVPAPPTTTYHYDFLRADGAWPHLSMRLRENWPHGIPSVRRILQYTATDAPSFLASAEQLYRETADVKESEPVTARGIERRGERLTMRAALSDGRHVELYPVYDSLEKTLPPGFGGSQAMTLLQASMTQPVTSFVSLPFAVGPSTEMKILTTGLLRDGLDVAIEEVDVSQDVSRERLGTNPRAVAMSAVSLALGMADEEHPERLVKARYVLANGDGRLYRLRMTIEPTLSDVYREDLDISPDDEEFEKTIDVSVMSVVDLRSRRVLSAPVEQGTMYAVPNPSTDHVTLVISMRPSHNDAGAPPSSNRNSLNSDMVNDRHHNLVDQVSSLVLDIVDTFGTIVLSTHVRPTDALELTGLPSGAYAARVRSAQTNHPQPLLTTTFVVVR